MKKIFLYITFLTITGCFGQTPVYSLFSATNYGQVDGAYYKDTTNDLNNFEGTWELVDGSKTFRITLQKHLLYYNDLSDLYTDMLTGEYKYIENGIEKVNTLGLITSPPEDLYGHSIKGNIILSKNNTPPCPECGTNEKRVSLSFSDPTRTAVEGLGGRVIIRRVDEGGVQKIKVWLRQSGNIIYEEGTTLPYDSFNVPWGEYILTKVE